MTSYNICNLSWRQPQVLGNHTTHTPFFLVLMGYLGDWLPLTLYVLYFSLVWSIIGPLWNDITKETLRDIKKRSNTSRKQCLAYLQQKTMDFWVKFLDIYDFRWLQSLFYFPFFEFRPWGRSFLLRWLLEIWKVH